MRNPTLKRSAIIAVILLPCGLYYLLTKLHKPARGDFGIPIGQLVTVQGVRVEKATKGGKRTLLVESVNGQLFNPPGSLTVENRGLSPATRYVLQGVQIEEWYGSRPGAKNPAQASWGRRVFFKVVKVVSATPIQAPQSQTQRG